MAKSSLTPLTANRKLGSILKKDSSSISPIRAKYKPSVALPTATAYCLEYFLAILLSNFSVSLPNIADPSCQDFCAASLNSVL
jgi:hypothetical protein